MAEYYEHRPSTTALHMPSESVQNKGAMPTEPLSEFDKHHESLLSDDSEESWASKLHHYLGMMQREVKKNTDIVEWWQVSDAAIHMSQSADPRPHRTTLNHF